MFGEGDRFILNPQGVIAQIDENTIGVVAIMGSTFDGSYEPVMDNGAPNQPNGP
jgi:glutamate decarboxylase